MQSISVVGLLVIQSVYSLTLISFLLRFPFPNRYVMRIYNRAEHENETLYFVATEKFLGNKASAYNRVLNFSIGHFIPGPQLQDFVIEYINNTEGDVILKGRYSDYSLVARLPQYPVDAATDYQVSKPTLNKMRYERSFN